MSHFHRAFQSLGVGTTLGSNEFVDLSSERNVFDAGDTKCDAREDGETMCLDTLYVDQLHIKRHAPVNKPPVGRHHLLEARSDNILVSMKDA